MNRLSLRHAALCLTAAIGASVLAQPGVDFDFASGDLDARRLATSELTAGHTVIVWESEADEAFFIVESSPQEDFSGAVVYYEGPERRTFVSGLEEGEHWFRVATRESADDEWGEWSEPASLTVGHHDLGVAFAFAGVGAFLFLSIVAFVVVAPRRVEA